MTDDMTMQEVPTAEIDFNPENPRKTTDKEVKGSDLFKSVGEFGVQIPVHIIKTNGHFTLLAGERRLRAAKLNGMDVIPAIIHDEDLAKASDTKQVITHLENFARKDLSIMEEGDSAQILMRLFKGDFKAVGSLMNMSEEQVRRRLKVTSLSRSWQKYLRSGEDDARMITLAHTELIARLTNKQQEDLFDYCDGDMVYNLGSATELEGHINRMYTLLLTGQAFMDTCADCKKRSDAEEQALLWAEGKGKKKSVQCLDRDCFKIKLESARDEKLLEAKAKYPNLLVVDKYDVDPCKKKDKDAVPCLDLSSNSLAVFWAKPRTSAAKKQATSMDPVTGTKKKVTKTLAQRKATLHGLRCKIALEGVRSYLQNDLKGVTPELVNNDPAWLTAILLAFGTRTNERFMSKNDWTRFKNLLEGKLDAAVVTANMVGDVLASRLTAQTGDEALKKEPEAKRIIALYKTEWEIFYNKAIEEKATPKAITKMEGEDKLRKLSKEAKAKAAPKKKKATKINIKGKAKGAKGTDGKSKTSK